MGCNLMDTYNGNELEIIGTIQQYMMWVGLTKRGINPKYVAVLQYISIVLLRWCSSLEFWGTFFPHKSRHGIPLVKLRWIGWVFAVAESSGYLSKATELRTILGLQTSMMFGSFWSVTFTFPQANLWFAKNIRFLWLLSCWFSIVGSTFVSWMGMAQTYSNMINM